MTLFSRVFSTKALVLIASVLGSALFMKGLGAHYEFSWVTVLSAQ
jgi:hypothetical protein